MGRTQNRVINRKERRKEHITVEELKETESETLGKAIKILIIVVVLFFAFYFIAYLFDNKSTTTNTTDTAEDTASTYDKILASETFKKTATEYYVLFFDTTSTNVDDYTTMISDFESSYTIPIYAVDLNDGLNTKYISTTSNPDAQTSTALKINGATLIKIENNKNVLYVEGENNIKTELE